MKIIRKLYEIISKLYQNYMEKFKKEIHNWL